MKTVTAIISDTHIGSTVGLAVPKFENDDGQLILASREQKWIYECWLDYWKYVYTLAKQYKARLIVIHLGDVIDGDHHQTTQALPNLNDQRRMALELLEPIANIAARMVILRGTGAHAGEASQDEVDLATELGAEIYWEKLLDIDGVLLDVAHHPISGVPETLARRAQYTALEEGNPIPRYCLRGHRHLIKDSGEQVKDTRAVILGAWTLRSGHGYKVASGVRSDIGGLIILPGGVLDMSRLRYQAVGGVGGRKVLAL